MLGIWRFRACQRERATRSPCSSARSGHRGCPGRTGRTCPRWPGFCPTGTAATSPDCLPADPAALARCSGQATLGVPAPHPPGGGAGLACAGAGDGPDHHPGDTGAVLTGLGCVLRAAATLNDLIIPGAARPRRCQGGVLLGSPSVPDTGQTDPPRHCLAPCPGPTEQHRGLVPGERPVCLQRIRGDDIDGGRDVPHGQLVARSCKMSFLNSLRDRLPVGSQEPEAVVPGSVTI